MSDFVLRPGTSPLPGEITSAAAAHQKLPAISTSLENERFLCHFDDPSQTLIESAQPLGEGLPPPSELPQSLLGGFKQLVSSHAGPLRMMLLTIPNYVVHQDALATIFRELPRVLPSDTHFVILTHAGARTTVEGWFERDDHAGCDECRITQVADEVAFTMWAEDPYAVGVDESRRPVLIEPQVFDRNADDLIASFVAPGAGFGRVASPLIFQGGNVLIGDNFYLVGADYLRLSLQTIEDNGTMAGKDGQFTPEIKAAIQRYFLDSGRRAHFLGCDMPLHGQNVIHTPLPMGPDGAVVDVREHIQNGSNPGTAQPIFHIDMFVTLVGRAAPGAPFRILVGDPRCAAKVLNIELPDHAQADAFDELAAKLADHEEFTVERNPLPYVHLDFHRRQDDTFHRWWYYASANNAIVERRPDRRPRVWLPSFGFAPWPELAATDMLNYTIWDNFGFDVTMMPNCHALAQNLGVIHCIKKYLAR